MNQITSPLPEDTLVMHVVQQAQQLPSVSTRERLAQALLDWFTAGWSGMVMPLAPLMRDVALQTWPEREGAPVFGGGRLPATGAAFCNAALAHLREIDDAHRSAMLHPGVVAVSPVLALAGTQVLTQRQVMAGVVAGYEVALRLGEALGPAHAGQFHATATAGAIGAAAAGVALGLEGPVLHHALGHAATQAAGLWQLADDGAHEAKSLHPGFAVRNGLMAVAAARAGLPAARAFFSGSRALYPLLGGAGPMQALTRDLDGQPWLHSATIKAWPSCAMTFTALDALQALVQQHGVQPGDVARVDVSIFSHALRIANVDWPSKAVETPFSLRYLVAALLHHGRLGIDEVEQPALQDAVLCDLGARVQVQASETFQRVFPQRRPAQVTLHLKNGQTLEAQRDMRRGDPEDPFDWPQLVARMRAFAPGMDDAHADALTAWCERLLDPALDDQPCRPAAALFGAD